MTMKNEEELVHHYLMALMVCNTVNIVKRDGKMIYESESPDEIAIIQYAKSMGYVFKKRDHNTIQAEINDK